MSIPAVAASIPGKAGPTKSPVLFLLPSLTESGTEIEYSDPPNVDSIDLVINALDF